MPTVGEAIEKVSELRSRHAILHELVIYLETHYKSSDAGPPELRMHRTDHAVVPEEHIEQQVTLLTVEMDQIQAELAEWGKLRITAPEDDDRPAKKLNGKKPARLANGAKRPGGKKRKPRGTTSQDNDPASSGHSQ
jgi:hypothetical protein